MSDKVSASGYRQLVEMELAAASKASDATARKSHLNQAAIYAHLSEQARSAMRSPHPA